MYFSVVADKIVAGQQEDVVELRQFAMELFRKPPTFTTVHLLSRIVAILGELVKHTKAECARRHFEIGERSAVLERVIETHMEALLWLRRSEGKLKMSPEPAEERRQRNLSPTKVEETIAAEETTEGTDAAEEKAPDEEEKVADEAEEENEEGDEAAQSCEEEGKPTEEEERQLPAIKVVGGLQHRPAAGGKPQCFYCDERHELYRCKPYQLLSNGERLRLVEQWKLCFNCFSSRHGAQEGTTVQLLQSKEVPSSRTTSCAARC